ncbi:MAG: hypothetical protein QOK71_10240, partial [Nitrososphaeraceae archaeon]|nr:hypothetical protein [Nitrososphaeraceae archaeon]
MPILESSLGKNLAREIFHKSLKCLLELIYLMNGIELEVNNKIIWFCSRISVIIADWPEAAKFCLTYKSTNSNFPCHSCLVTRNNLAKLNLLADDIKLRSHEDMRKHFDDYTKKSVSIK